jgi:hypothetical protein
MTSIITITVSCPRFPKLHWAFYKSKLYPDFLTVDKNNTAHYDYSALLYLSDFGSDQEVSEGEADFSGGVFDFNDDPASASLSPTHAAYSAEAEEIFAKADATNSASLAYAHPSVTSMTYVLPRAGRLVMFSSGQENLHRVSRVLSGKRLALSLWFTLDPQFKVQPISGRPHEQALAAAQAQARRKRQRRRQEL